MPNAKAFFNNAAAIWDRKSRKDEAAVNIVLRLSDLTPGLTMLDAGCGTGFLEPYLLRAKPEKITAVDFAENMIAVAKKKLSDPVVEFLCMDIFDLDPRLHRFNFCIFYNAFPHFEEHALLASHLAKLILPGGRLTISHTQGKRTPKDNIMLPWMPAHWMVSILRPYFRLDVIADNNALFMVSGIRLKR